MKEKEIECSAHTFGTNWDWLVYEGIGVKALANIFLILDSSTFVQNLSSSTSILITNEDHQLLATSLNKDPDQLKV